MKTDKLIPSKVNSKDTNQGKSKTSKPKKNTSEENSQINLPTIAPIQAQGFRLNVPTIAPIEAIEKFQEAMKQKNLKREICFCCKRQLLPTQIGPTTKAELKNVDKLHLKDFLYFDDEDISNDTKFYCCNDCGPSLKKGSIPIRVIENGLYFEPVPEVLQNLSLIEKMAISIHRPMMVVFNLADNRKQKYSAGNCITFLNKFEWIIPKNLPNKLCDILNENLHLLLLWNVVDQIIRNEILLNTSILKLTP